MKNNYSFEVKKRLIWCLNGSVIRKEKLSFVFVCSGSDV